LEFAGGYQVNIATASESEACFENTLSESDKRLLAFAFFIAEVKLDANRSNLVVFLDDPMSSFDAERKLATANILSGVSDEVEQIIVLTHEEGFLRILHKHLSDCSLFKIIAKDSTSSSIEAMDINDEYLEPHYKNITLLEEITQGNREAAPDDLRCMRDITEDIMLRKYYTLLKNDHRNGKSTGAFMTTLKAAGVYDDQTIEEINGLYLHFWNHDDSTKAVTRNTYSVGDLQTIAQQFLKTIHKL
jgi:wobble nucleotide-excising tRNase